MMMLLFLAFLVGAGLGLRFKVFVLVPAALTILTFITGTCFIDGFDLSRVSVLGLSTIASIQVGYVGGSALGAFLRRFAPSRPPPPGLSKSHRSASPSNCITAPPPP